MQQYESKNITLTAQQNQAYATKQQNRHIQNILLIEDSYVQALSLKTRLEMENLTVKIVNGGSEAIEQIQKQMFDLIVLGIEPSTLNGYETCHYLKAYLVAANIPVILFTRRNSSVDTLTDLELDIIDHIPKSVFAQATLVNTIRQLNKSVIDDTGGVTYAGISDAPSLKTI